MKNEFIPTVPPGEGNFDYQVESPKLVDKSDWVASITSLNGGMNGTVLPYALGLDPKTNRIPLYEPEKGKGSRVSEGFNYVFKVLAILDNLLSWKLHSNTPAEVVRKTMNLKNCQILQLDI
jgi:hypothetical protein